MTADTAAARFAEHALSTRYQDMPPAAVQAAKRFILDSLGVGIAGSSVEGAAELLAVAQGWGDAAESQIWGRRGKLSAAAAVFINAWQMHNQEYDCLHEGAVVHAMASVLPAALAAAERRGGVDGQTLITAIAVGVDVAATLGLASRAGFRFFRPATAGGFGAVAAAGRVLGLDQADLRAGFAWQLAQASGTMQAHVEGSPILPVQVGFNARAALHSCDLARCGFAPAEQVFEGPYGYLALFEGAHDLPGVLDSLGRDWRISEFSHKPFPAGRATHGGIEGVMALRDAHGFAAEEVEAVIVAAPPLIVRLVGRPPVADAGASYARLCMAYTIAKVLQHGALDPLHFRDAALSDLRTRALAERVQVVADDNPDPNALAPQTVTLRLRKGQSLTWHCETMLAHPQRPLTRAQQEEKFRRCLALSAESLPVGLADRLIEAVDALDRMADVRDLAALLAGR